MKQLEQEHKVLNGEAKRQAVFKIFKNTLSKLVRKTSFTTFIC